ncbi:hypothetical protein [Herbidospora cretacea]|uniref:hypothetical protein n=1 Tax=Herbidospora cretacea TaxID=28444 RepID=UPI0004C42A88|nr:hypothetical protein [Herbidospora cretacea]
MRWTECPGGVHVHGDHGAATLRGLHALALLERLAPRLDGTLTLGELTSGLPETQRDLVTSLVGRLADLRFVIDDTGAQAHGLSAEDLETYAPEIAFAGHPGRFARVRNSVISVTGTGILVPALVECLESLGWREVAASGGDVRVQVGTSREELLAEAMACPADVTLAQVLICDDEAWLTSAGPPQETDAATGWRRLSLREGTRRDWLRGAVPRVLASQVALGVFSAVTGLTEARRVFTRVDLRSLDSTIHRFAGLRWDAHSAAGSGSRAAVTGSAHSPDARDRFFTLCRDLVDPRMGLIRALDEGAYPQGPLSVVRALVGDEEVVGWGTDHDTARLRCLLAVFAANSGDGFVGAGLTWEDAVSAAHRQRLEAGAAQMEAGERVPVPHDHPLWRQIVASGEVPLVREIPGSSVLRFEVPGRPPIVSLGLHDGLERVLLRAQTGLQPPVRWAGEGPPIGGAAVSLPVDGPAFVARVTS